MKSNLTIKLLIISIVFSCAPDNKNQVETSKKGSQETDSKDPLNDTSPTTDTTPGLENINITCSQASGDILTASLNQSSVWTFSATGPDGQPATIQSISSTPTFPTTSFSVQGSSLTFKPSSQSELSGSITVTAATGVTTESKTFTIQSSSGNTNGLGKMLGGGGGFASLLTQILPKIMSGGNPLESLQSLGGANGGGIGNLSGLMAMFNQGGN